jgi:putative component of membrane protein insertase Oxa1/YidC/SpoIIIJ protein YidD
LEAITRYGIFKGAVLAGKRLARCHPWHIGGHDPLPKTLDTKDLEKATTALKP